MKPKQSTTYLRPVIVKEAPELKSYPHDSLPRPYTGMGEDYEVLPGNKRTTRHRVSLRLDFEPNEIELAKEFVERINALISKIESTR